MIAFITASVVMFAIGAAVFRGTALALFSIVCFVSAPVVWAAETRLLYELSAELAWIFILLHIDRTSPAWRFAAIGIVLGLGAYTHPGAIVTMPLLLAAGALIVIVRGDASPLDRRIGVMALAGLAVAGPLILRLSDRGEWDRLVGSHALYDAARFNPAQGIREMFSWVGLVARSDVYYRSFDPTLLFISGGSLRQAMASPAVFLLPLAVLIPIGLYATAINRPKPREASILWAALAVPIAAALTAQSPVAARLLLLAPYATLLAVRGVERLVASSRPGWRYAGFAAAASVPLFAVLAALR